MEKDPEAQSSGGVESTDMKIKELKILISRDQDPENDEEDHESDEDHLGKCSKTPVTEIFR